MTIALSPQARQDLRQLYQQIAQDDPEAADRVLARTVEVIGMLASGGVEGREVHLADGRQVRTWHAAQSSVRPQRSIVWLRPA